MVSDELVGALTEARRRIPRETWEQLTTRIATFEGKPNTESIRLALAGTSSGDGVWVLTQGFQKSAASWSEIAGAMTAVNVLLQDSEPVTEIIWTGPSDNRLSIRRFDQVLYDLVSKAKKRILLVTFAAHRVPRLCDLLSEAVQRGVEITLIVESEGESEGQLTRDAVAAFTTVPVVRARIYYWPLTKRERNAGGRPGKLHVKCAVIDDVALIGSANLTDDAFNRNMELGIVIRDSATVRTIEIHFEELIHGGFLVEADRLAAARR